MMKISRFAIFAWGVLVYNLVVILWGVYVRASGSGAGCGSHWPLCNGVVVPISPQMETAIEFTHRVTSGLSLLLMVVLLVWAFRSYPHKSSVRLGAVLSMVFIITEALVGAGLVLFDLVGANASTSRVVSMAVHLINTFLLLAAITLTAWWASTGFSTSLKNRGILLWVFGIGLIGIIILGISGAITALGDTLFPSTSLAQGIQQDFSPTAHFVIRLRVWHPITAIIIGAYLIIVGGLIAMYANDESKRLMEGGMGDAFSKERRFSYIKRSALFVIGAVCLQLFAGLLNLLLLAPTWMQLLHLFLADMVWISLVILAANNFGKSNVGEAVKVIESLGISTSAQVTQTVDHLPISTSL